MCFTNAHAKKNERKKQRKGSQGAARTAKFMNTATTAVIQNISQDLPSALVEQYGCLGVEKGLKHSF